MRPNLLARGAWQATATAPDTVRHPSELGPLHEWIDATVPGTAAGALRDAGIWDDRRDLDAEDWWFRCRFPRPAGAGPWTLHFDGIATISDVWLNGKHVLQSENMFRRYDVALDELEAMNEITIRCAGIGPRLHSKHPRPRWKTQLVSEQNLRWYRTTLLGRTTGWASIAPPVGPWRDVRLEERSPITRRDIRTSSDGTVSMVFDLDRDITAGSITVGDATSPLHVDGRRAEATVHVTDPALWWPHTHGAQPLYDVRAEIDGRVIDLGRVGFRTIHVDRSDGAFTLSVNGVEIFCRGADWVPPDAITLNADPAPTLGLLRDAGMNMVRITGTNTYETDHFFDLCDELGILVWQDCMFANFDPPTSDAFDAEVAAELSDIFGALQGRPSLAVVCGGSEVEQQAAMLGLSADRRTMPLFDETIPGLVEDLLPGTPYVSSSPTGGDFAFHVDSGISHYYGVGAYLRPPDDARRAGVRFATECLAFSNPPEPSSVEEIFGSARVAGHDPVWKRTVPRDAGASWDFEDVRDHYVRELYGVDPSSLRSTDPERYLDLGRAAVAELMTSTLSEWRRPGSSCDGALVFTLRDLWPGSGWGVVDALGRPKAPWFALKRVLEPLALVVTDEGLNGLDLHVFNDTPDDFEGTLRVETFGTHPRPLEHAERTIDLPARSATTIRADALFDGFRDLSYAYRFGPPSFDAVVATLLDRSGVPRSTVVHLPAGSARPVEDIGLDAQASRIDDRWVVRIETTRLAQYVAIEADGFRPDDSWFHLPPGAVRVVALRPTGETTKPRGTVRALNARSSADFEAAS